MESPEVDIKPVIPTDDVPDKNSHSGPGASKFKQSRYEDVWPEDVHAAFMEAVVLYPPMGKRRLKYYRVSTHEDEHLSDCNRAKSFGRCQLIQSYILEKTGKNRSRKQVSSHLQRLKKIHKDNPTMCPLFSERSQPPLEHYSAPQPPAISSQDNISSSSRHVKNDFDLIVNPPNTGTGANSSTMFTYASEASPINNGSCNSLDLSTNLQSQPSFFLPQEFTSSQQCLLGIPHPSDGDYLSEFQDQLPFRDTMNGGIRTSSTFNTSAFSISMRRLASKFPSQGRQVDSSTFSRAVHSPGFQPMYQWISHDGPMSGVPTSFPFTLTQHASHTPLHPLQSIAPEKRLDPGLESEWMWPQNPDIPLGPRESFGEMCIRHSPAMYHHTGNLTCPEMRFNTPGSHGSPSESELPRLPRGIPYSYEVTSLAAVSENILNKSAIDFSGQIGSESSEDLAPPLVIRPTPIYPVSYVHPKIHTNGHIPTDSDSSFLDC